MGPVHRWFSGGLMNTCYNALDVHVQNGRGDVPAMHYDSPLTDIKTTVTYAELLQQGAVALLRGAFGSRMFSLL